MRDRDADCRLIDAQAKELDRLREDLARARAEGASSVQSFCGTMAEAQEELDRLREDLARVRAERDRLAVAYSAFLYSEYVPTEEEAAEDTLALMTDDGRLADPALAAALAEHDRRSAAGPVRLKRDRSRGR